MALKGEVIKIHFQRLYDPVLCFPLYRRFIHEIFYVLPLKLLRKISSNQIGIIFFVRCFVSNSILSTLLCSCILFFFFKQIEFLLRFVTGWVALFDLKEWVCSVVNIGNMNQVKLFCWICIERILKIKRELMWKIRKSLVCWRILSCVLYL